MRLATGQQPAEAVLLVAQLSINQWTIEKLDGHAQVRVTRSLAGADRLALGLTEDL